MVEKLDNIYIYFEDNRDFITALSFEEIKRWANNVNICINLGDKLKLYNLACGKLKETEGKITDLTRIVSVIMARKFENSLFISDTDLVKICQNNNIAALEEGINNGNSKKFLTDIGLGMSYYGKAKYVIFNFEDIDEDYLKSVFYRKIGRPMEIFETKRLLVREMSLDDMPAYIKLYESLNQCEFVEKLYPYEEEVEFVRKYIENMYTFFGYGLWLVFLKETGELIGRVGIENREIDGRTKQEIGYLIDSKYQGQGLAYEACEATIDYAREMLELDELFACIHRDNFKSIALAEKLGFRIYARNVGEMNLYRLDI